MTDSNTTFKGNTNGLEGKTPFLIGVAGGTASGKVTKREAKQKPFITNNETITEHCL